MNLNARLPHFRPAYLTLVLASLASAPPSRAQNSSPDARDLDRVEQTLPVPSPDLPTQPGRPPDPFQPESPDKVPWKDDLRRAQDQATRAMRDVERQIGGIRFGFAGPDARRLLVIPGANVTDESLAGSRDDLAVMSTILKRVTNPDKGRRPDLLVELNDWHFGGGRELDALLIDGYGAIFLLGVDFPLVGPAPQEEKPVEPKAKRDNTWERTRREVLGQAEPDDDGREDEAEARPEPAFDPISVELLEQRLKEALQHAGNLRGLTPEDWIIVQVTGPQHRSGNPERSGTKPKRNWMAHPDQRRGGGSSVMTLRVRKSAVDALAADHTKLEEFVREVKVSRRLEKPAADGGKGLPAKF